MCIFKQHYIVMCSHVQIHPVSWHGSNQEVYAASVHLTRTYHINLQAGHFGQAPFDPAGLTDDYKRQAEVGPGGQCLLACAAVTNVLLPLTHTDMI